MQNRFAYAKRASLTYTEVTRRDGLSSWRVIFFVAAGMLSGKSTVNLLCKISVENPRFLMKEPIRFRQEYFSACH